MSWSDVLAGLALLTLVLAGTGLATARIARARQSHLEGPVRATAIGIVFAGIVVAVHLVPLALGVLERWTVLLATAVAVAVAWRVPAAPGRPRDEPRAAPSSRAAWAVAGLVAGFAVLFVAAFIRQNRALAPDDLDSTTFILPTVVEWVQRGSLWHAVNLAEGWPFAEYPHTGNLLDLAVVLPFDSDFLVRFLGPLGMVAAAVAGYALACELRAPRAAAATFSILAVMMSGTAVSALDSAHTDVWAAAWLTGGGVFLLRHARTSDGTDLALAGVSLGLAFGTKWYGPPFAAVAGAVWLAARLLQRADVRRTARDAVGLGALVLAVGGIWLVRNLVESGDPLFPAKIAPLGIVLWEGAPSQLDRLGFSIAHYLPDWEVFRGKVVPQLWDSFNWPALLLGVTMVTAAALAFTRRRPDVVGVVATGLLVIAVYVALPGTSLGLEGDPTNVGASARYPAFAFLCGAAATAWLAGRLGRFEPALHALALPAMVAAAAHYDDWSLDVRFAVLNLGDLAAGGVLLAGVAVLATGGAFLVRRGRAGVAVAAVAGLAVAAVALNRQADQYLAARYRNVDPTYEHVITRAPEGNRIGLTGEPTRPRAASQIVMYGPRFGNRVELIAREVRHMPLRHTDREAFLSDLRAGEYDLLLVGEPGGPEREGEWARANGWRPLVRGNGFSLLVRAS